LDGVLVRELIEIPDQKEPLLATSLALKLAGTAFVVIFVYLALMATSEQDPIRPLVLIIAFATFFQSLSVIDCHFQSQVLAKYSTLAQVFSMGPSSGVRLALIALGASLLWFGWAVMLEYVLLASAFLALYLTQRPNLDRWHFQRNLALRLLRNAWPLMLSNLSIMVYMRIDQIMIKEMLSAESLGTYAAAVRLSEAFYFIPMAVCASLFPIIVNANRQGTEFYLNKLQLLYDLMVCLALFIALPATLFSKAIVSLTLGDQYFAAAGVFQIHVWASVFVFLGVASGKSLLVENLQMYSLYGTLVGAIANVLLNFILIPRIGIQGAALATVASQFSSAYLTLAFFPQTRKTFWLATNSLNPFHAIERLYHA
jgi:O-antigen/teichoic acid export membrane protein